MNNQFYGNQQTPSFPPDQQWMYNQQMQQQQVPYGYGFPPQVFITINYLSSANLYLFSFFQQQNYQFQQQQTYNTLPPAVFNASQAPPPPPVEKPPEPTMQNVGNNARQNSNKPQRGSFNNSNNSRGGGGRQNSNRGQGWTKGNQAQRGGNRGGHFNSGNQTSNFNQPRESQQNHGNFGQGVSDFNLFKLMSRFQLLNKCVNKQLEAFDDLKFMLNDSLKKLLTFSLKISPFLIEVLKNILGRQ